MQIFYAPDIKGDNYILDKKESRHSVRVLRMKKGTAVKLIDGQGNLYEGIITDPDPAGCEVKVLNAIRDFEKRNYKLHIAISPLKNPERFEWFVEKSVEIGIDEITPLICRNTEKPGIKEERIRNLIIAAMKQSLKARICIMNSPCLFREFINKGNRGVLMIAHCNKKLNRSGIGEVYHKGENPVIMIGPEGDFSEDEIEEALAKGYLPVHMGPSRLRTETAGIAACHSIYFINQLR
jgi:16S rRNA (uracil1498-N3)-methyltransferase